MFFKYVDLRAIIHDEIGSQDAVKVKNDIHRYSEPHADREPMFHVKQSSHLNPLGEMSPGDHG